MVDNIDNPNYQGNPLDDYKKTRDIVRQKNKQAEVNNPKTALAGEIVGSLLAPGPKIAKGEKFLPAAGKLALGGALYGAGSSESDDISGVAIDSALGGAGGAILGGTANSILNKGLPSLAGYLKNKVGFNALGGQTPQAKYLKNSGLTPEEVTDFALTPQTVNRSVTELPLDKGASEQKIKVSSIKRFWVTRNA